MNDLELLYADIESKGKAAIQSGSEFVDLNLSHVEQDHRLALTLLISLHGPIVKALRALEQQIRTLEPQQYYYPDADMHVTLIELICATPTFTRDEMVIQQGIEIIEEAIRNLEPFDISFKGIIASNGAILAKGYYQDGVLVLRESVRKIARERGFDLKERYQSISAHTVIGRFMVPVSNREQLLAKIQEYQDFEIGTIRVDEMELVIHDCYHSRKEEVQKFVLGASQNKAAENCCQTAK